MSSRPARGGDKRLNCLRNAGVGTRCSGAPIPTSTWECSGASTSAKAAENGATLDQRRYVTYVAEQNTAGPHTIEDILQLEAGGRHLGRPNVRFVDRASLAHCDDAHAGHVRFQNRRVAA